jgi:hypothetical protein
VDDPNMLQKDVQAQNKVTVKRPIAKRAGRSISECSIPVSQPQSSPVIQNFRKPLPEVQPYSEISNSNGKIGQSMYLK